MKITLFLLVIMLVGCDAPNEANGYVLDKETNKPIDSIRIGSYEKKDEDWTKPYTLPIYSDKLGSFHYMHIGMTIHFELYFSKNGYITKEQEFSSSDRIDTIYMEKSK